MAALMDDDYSSSARARGLGVSKSSSSKISKLKRGGGGGTSTTSNAPLRPPPTVYKTEPEGFRSLVQELTGPSSASRTQQQQQQQPSSRLQRMAPPPLSALAPPLPTPIAPFAAPSPKFAFPFSPLVDFSPRDLMWAAGLESPGTADMKTLAQLVSSPLASPPRTPSFFSSNSFAGFSFAGL